LWRASVSGGSVSLSTRSGKGSTDVFGVDGRALDGHALVSSFAKLHGGIKAGA